MDLRAFFAKKPGVGGSKPQVRSATPPHRRQLLRAQSTSRPLWAGADSRSP